MLTEALLVAVWAFFCGIDKYDVALNIHRPLITGPVVGLIMGDLQLGLITGATLELAWLGLVPNAGAQPPDVTMGTIAAVAFAVMTGQSAEVAMGVGMPIAVLMQMLVIGFFAVTSFTMGKADEYAEQANTKGIDFLLISTISLRSLLYAIVAFITVYFGEHAADWINNNSPKEILEGLGLGARLVPAIGFAMLLKIMWSKQVAGVFFIGFVATTYLKLPIMAVAIIGGSIAVLYFYFSGNGNNNNQSQAQEFEDGI
ncbi:MULTISPECIES: PTS N-acetylgalactosamine transporter subunit IIC [unclassified Avibacterium]|uniref:PTS N-acetylgalactosamine transporter subunit IIC n=1 Tax=unclassified Avibacterium TaxID=2685287 RepID=UPI0020263FA3|nr:MULTISPECIES: PTS N-acetylgalactosamine transporter subunit IIC [unclassified Avibacterium]MCW9698524.1 PTS mannose/fructose/sorbose/N-acetylgalactosamine transporter subunit IIC [Avibacterium sp. 20-129]URL07242.1 PTS mannose/fructose/sorbose/N-acetylgalactosamine transporter subunit IIC [Avibacterium sp. 21-595]